MTDVCCFTVVGAPVPKQSFRYTANGGGYIDPRVLEWQKMVSTEAKAAMLSACQAPGTAPVAVHLDFYLPTRRRVELDNLSKGVLDALKTVVFDDDDQVVELHLRKKLNKGAPGVAVLVRECLPGSEGFNNRQARECLS